MSHFPLRRRALNWIALAAFACGLPSARALTAAGPNRPATVPQNYVITPFGYFHPSCVAHLAEGDMLRQEENSIRHADGSSESMPVCGYPHFDARGVKVALDAPEVAAPTISHAWVEYSSATTGTSYGSLSANWVVPPAPISNHGQTVYLFPGLEDYRNAVTIIQPVLGWNSDYAQAWGIASWNCCASGTVYESAPVRVNTGDTIYGAMTNNCAAGTLACPTWNITTQDVTLGKSTTLSKSSSQGQTFDWAFGGAVEVYGIVQCGDYPANGSVSFYNVILTTDSLAVIANPGWSVTNLSAGLTPQCGYGGSLPHQVNLRF